MGYFLIILTFAFGALPIYEAFEKKENKKGIYLVIIGALLLFLQTCKSCGDDKETKAKDSTISGLKSDLRYANSSLQNVQKDLDSANKIGSTTQTLSELNVSLSKKLDTLSQINNAIATNNQSLAKDGKNLITQNLSTTNNISQLTENAKCLVDKIYDEHVGGNSIPIVAASTYEDKLPPEDSEIDYKSWGDNPPTNNYLNSLTLANTGDYKITDLSITTSSPRGRLQPVIKVLYDDNLQPFEVKDILTEIITPLTPEPDSTDPNPHPYYIPNYNEGDDGDPITVTVHWRNITYQYQYIIKGGGSRRLYITDHYTYKGKEYTRQKLIAKILRERLLAKKLRNCN